MRNAYQTKSTAVRNQPRRAPNLVCLVAFVSIASWSGQSHASNLWLWAWLGVADIQVVQNAPNSSDKAKTTLTSIALTKSTTSEPVKPPVVGSVKSGTNLAKAQSGDDVRGKDCKGRSNKFIIM